MDHSCLPGQLLYLQLKDSKQNQERPRLRFRNTVKQDMKKIDMVRDSWQKMSKCEDGWRCLIKPN